MKKIGYPVEFEQLHDTITADDPVTPFTFSDCFSELLDTDNIEMIKGDDQSEAFIITQKGINVCENLLYLLIPSVQRIAAAAAQRLIRFDQKGIKSETSLSKEHGEYRLNFSITERNERLFSMELGIENEKQALQYQEKIKTDPEGFYKSVLNILDK